MKTIQILLLSALICTAEAAPPAAPGHSARLAQIDAQLARIETKLTELRALDRKAKAGNRISAHGAVIKRGEQAKEALKAERALLAPLNPTTKKP